MFFEKIRIKTKSKLIKQIRICNYPLIEYYDENNKKRRHHILLPNFHSKYITYDNDNVFYLKVNRSDDYAFRCLQHWLNIAECMKVKVYIICDNKKLEQKIYKHIIFSNNDINIIKSVHKPLNKIVKNIATKLWIKATYAHLTTFWHAKEKNFKSFWNIDADDTMLELDANVCANILKDISQYAKNNDIKAFSLDMHTSRTKGKHWSFGITYTNSEFDWFNLLNANTNTDWRNKYLSYDYHFNLDWFFTYLRDKNICNIKTFYIENLYFIHYGDFLSNTIGSGVFHWINNRVEFPILLDIFGSQKFGDIPISKSCIKFDYKLSPQMAFDFITNTQTYLEIPSLPRDNMWLSESEELK